MRDYALILANDFSREEEILALTAQTAPYLDGVKLGLTSTLHPGLDIFLKVQALLGDKPLFADFKIADIGHYEKKTGRWEGTNAKILRTLTGLGIQPYVTVHAFPGPASLEEAITVAHQEGAKVLTLAHMTGKGADLFFGHPLRLDHTTAVLQQYYGDRKSPEELEDDLHDFEMTFPPSARTLSTFILWLGHELGTDGYIAPLNRPDLLEVYTLFPDKEIWSPGLGRQDTLHRSLDQQFRDWAEIVGPDSRAIVGSLLSSSPDPAQAASDLSCLRDRVVASL